MITDRELEKYSRQIKLREVGVIGQEKIIKSKIAIVGIGALGTNTAELLTRAGVGEILLIDNDKIEESNLQRQRLFIEKDVGRAKVDAAQEKLQEINSLVQINALKMRLGEENIQRLSDYDLIMDCTDNLKTRFLINRFCRKKKKRWIYAACVKTTGYVMPILPDGPCLECFLKEVQLDTAATVGIINTLPSIIASLQVMIALKILLEKEVEAELYYVDVWKMELRKIKIKKNKICSGFKEILADAC